MDPAGLADMTGYDDNISAEDFRNFDVWCEAESAALDACCAGWNEERKPLSADLELVDPYRHRDRLTSGVFRQV